MACDRPWTPCSSVCDELGVSLGFVLSGQSKHTQNLSSWKQDRCPRHGMASSPIYPSVARKLGGVMSFLPSKEGEGGEGGGGASWM